MIPNRTASDIGVEMDSKEKELQKALADNAVVEQEILLIARKIIDLQGQKKDLEYARSKSSQVIRLLNSELRVLKNQFYAAKNSGL